MNRKLAEQILKNCQAEMQATKMGSISEVTLTPSQYVILLGNAAELAECYLIKTEGHPSNPTEHERG